MPPPGRTLLGGAALVAALLGLAGPTRAAEVIVVQGDHATRIDDPFVADSWRTDLAAPTPPGRASIARRPSRGRRALLRALRKANRKGRISDARYGRYRRIYRRALKVRRGLGGARGQQLGYVIVSIERIALGRRLSPSRMTPLFIQLQRNTRYWPHMPFPATAQDVTFGRSELLYRYFSGRGLQLHPLGTFIKANNLHGACVGAREEPCSRTRLARLLDEMSKLAVRRSRRFIAWEYDFDFGGGAPPWMSGMAQATGIQALGRASNLLGRPDYAATARKALGAFETAPPSGVRTSGFRGGTHYLQYSFAPRTYIFNAFIQSLLGLRDFGKDTADARSTNLFLDAEPEARREIPYSDLGDWSLYSYNGEVSDPGYHELLRDVLHSMCIRKIADLYCTYARRYRRYQTEPPEIVLTSPDSTTEEKPTRVRFTLSKLSVVEVQVYKNGKRTLDAIATFRRGKGSFLWTPRSPGTFTVRLGAKELRTGQGLRGRDFAEVEVENVPG